MDILGWFFTILLGLNIMGTTMLFVEAHMPSEVGRRTRLNTAWVLMWLSLAELVVVRVLQG